MSLDAFYSDDLDLYTELLPRPVLPPTALADALRDLAHDVEVGRFPLGSRTRTDEALAVDLYLRTADAVHELAREFGYDAADVSMQPGLGITSLTVAYGTGTGVAPDEADLPWLRAAVIVRAVHCGGPS